MSDNQSDNNNDNQNVKRILVDMSDPRYVNARNKLIPLAEREAYKQVIKHQDRGSWDRAFLAAMDRLAKEHGIVQ